jgi:aerobic carbon-monoxide dehydrogenase large subunit
VTTTTPIHRHAGGRVIGLPLPRLEDIPLLRGEARFCGDIELPGMLDVAFVRSYLAHGRVESVDTSDARSMPGVEAVVVGADVPLDLTPRLAPPNGPVYTTPRPLLTRDRVRYVGEPVAAVVATSRYLAEDACEHVLVDYQELPAIANLEQALASGAEPLHPTESNVLFEHDFDSGGVDEAFDSADVVIERSFRIPRLAPAPIETRGIVAVAGDDGLRIWYSTQTPHVLRRVLAELLPIDEEQISVVCPSVGGGFGMKSHVYPEDVLIPLIALRLRRPVRWLEDRSENLIASCHARGQELRARVAAGRDGVVAALELETVVDVGAYGIYPHGQLLEALGTPVMSTGPYRIPELRFRARAVATNKCPGGGYRGVGLAAAVFVHERLMDIVGGAVSIDPAEVRRRNLIAPDELPWANPVGLTYDSGDYPAALEMALDAIEYADRDRLRARAEARGRLAGVGLCAYVEYTGMGSNVFQERGMTDITGHEEARVAVEADGSVLVRVSVPPAGQGSETAFRQLVADTLDLDPAVVTVAAVDSLSGLSGSGSFGSRGTVVGGSAVLLAARGLRDRMLEIAAQVLEMEIDDLELELGFVQPKMQESRRIAIGELVALSPSGYLDVSARHDPLETTFSYGVHACAVEVDPELGSVEILRYVIVDDCGRIINPLVVDGQSEGSTAQGIGAALFEAMLFDDDGQPVNGSFVDYLLPSATDIPSFEVLHLEHPPPDSIGGFKGVGEGGTVAAPPAVLNAISAAIGVEINEIPATPELIVTRIATRREEAAA